MRERPEGPAGLAPDRPLGRHRFWTAEAGSGSRMPCDLRELTDTGDWEARGEHLARGLRYAERGQEDMKEISAQELRARLEAGEDLAVLDVREPHED